MSSVDENPNAPKKAQINNMISRLSRAFTQTGVNERIYELIANSELYFTFVWDKNFIEFLPYVQPTVKPPSYPALVTMFPNKVQEMKESLKPIVTTFDCACMCIGQ